MMGSREGAFAAEDVVVLMQSNTLDFGGILDHQLSALD